MLIWTSYRYCIGRKTYVVDVSEYIAKNYYDRLSDERLEFMAKDIRESIGDNLRIGRCLSLIYDGTVSYERRKPLEDLFEFLASEKIDSEEKALGIREVTIYHENYKEDAPHLYAITYNKEPNVRCYINPHDFTDLQPWANLAALFDKKSYKRVKTIYGEEVCYESWIEKLAPIDEKKTAYRAVPWQWEKVYVPINSQNAVRNPSYINPEVILSVEDIVNGD